MEYKLIMMRVVASIPPCTPTHVYHCNTIGPTSSTCVCWYALKS